MTPRVWRISRHGEDVRIYGPETPYVRVVEESRLRGVEAERDRLKEELHAISYRYGACPQCGGPMELPLEGSACAACEFPEFNQPEPPSSPAPEGGPDE